MLETLREERTLSEIAAGYEVNPNQLGNWKREFLERAGTIFDEPKEKRELCKACQQADSEKSEMLKTIGRLTMERDCLKAAVEKRNNKRLL